MSLNHKLIEDTKLSVKEVLRSMEKFTDNFVDFIVQSKPELFKLDETKGDDAGVMNPFVIVELLSKQLETKFDQYTKEVLGKPAEKKSGDVVQFPGDKKPKFDN